MSDLEEQFEETADRAQNLPEKPSNDQLLEMYALYKQASEGDVTGDRPGFTDFRGRAKYDAWAEREGMDQQEAMQRYIDLVERLEDQLAG